MSDKVTRRHFRFEYETPAQTEEDVSFAGGHPKLPASIELPRCTLCGEPLLFFWQHAFLEGPWAGKSLAFFSATICAHKDWSIPEMVEMPDSGYPIPEGFLERYQRNFRVFVFPTDQGMFRRDYVPQVRFGRLARQKARRGCHVTIGGNPKWIMWNETPGLYAGRCQPHFLMQFSSGLEFPLLPGCRGQDTGFGFVTKDDCWFFNSNEVYFFGVTDQGRDLVYISTQK